MNSVVYMNSSCYNTAECVILEHIRQGSVSDWYCIETYFCTLNRDCLGSHTHIKYLETKSYESLAIIELVTRVHI